MLKVLLSHIDTNQAQIIGNTIDLDAYVNEMFEFVESNTCGKQLDRKNFDILLSAQDFF